MNDICLYKLLEENRFLSGTQFEIRLGEDLFYPYAQFKSRLALLCCNVCKKLDSKEKLNKYEKLFIFPIIVSQRRDKKGLTKMFGIGLLERIAEEFGNADGERVKNFLENLREMEQGKVQYSYVWLNNISEGTYCKIAARLFWMEYYDLLITIAIQYIVNMTAVTISNVRTNWYHKNSKEEPFFQIGIALDEGIIQKDVMELQKYRKLKESTETESLDFLSEAYYFEMKFVDKLIDTFKWDWIKYAGGLISYNVLDILAEETRKIDYCDLYNLLYLSDQQRWKEVNVILKKYRR